MPQKMSQKMPKKMPRTMHPGLIGLIVMLVVGGLIGLGFLLFGKKSPPTQPSGCKLASDCSGKTPICKAGKCEKCSAQNRCPASKPVCSGDGACVGCVLDSDCGPGEECKNGNCVIRPCAGDADCPPGTACNDGQCGPIPCEADAGCEKPFVCERGQCTLGCEEDLDCGDGKKCEGNHCVPKPCSQNVDCGRLLCKNGTCVEECSADSECKQGEVCDEGRCQPNFICKNTTECGRYHSAFAGTHCVQGDCARPCITDALCPDGSECLEGYCQRTKLPCPAGTFLSKGLCIKRECTPDEPDCKDGLIAQQCKDDSRLASGAICVNNKIYNPPCISPEEGGCPACGALQYRKRAPAFFGNKCVDFFKSFPKSKPSKANDGFLLYQGNVDKTECLKMCRSNQCGLAWTDAQSNNCVLWSGGVNRERQAHPSGETHNFEFDP